MKKILFSLLFAPFFLFSQNERVFTGKCAIAQTGGNVSYWQVSITNFNDPGGLWDATEISEGDKLFFSDGGYPYGLTIDTVLSSIGSVATIRVLKAGVTGISSVPTTSNAFVSRGTVGDGLYPWVANLSGNDNQLAQEYNMVLIGSSIDGAKDTLYLPDGTVLANGDTINILRAIADSIPPGANLVLNGSFADSTNWMFSGTGVAIYSGVLVFEDFNGASIMQSLTLETGETYEISVDILNAIDTNYYDVQFSVNADVLDGFNAGQTLYANLADTTSLPYTYTTSFTATQANNKIEIASFADSVVFDNLIVRHIAIPAEKRMFKFINGLVVYADSTVGIKNGPQYESDIDSFLLQNDLNFASVGVVRQLTDSVATYFPKTLFVSLSGNNTTAEKGNPARPWADPQAAVTAASAGDVVWVTADTFIYSGTGQNFTLTNLAKPDVTVHMAPGAVIWNRGSTTTHIFNITQAGVYKLTGNGSFIGTTVISLFEVAHASATVIGELDSYINGGNLTQYGQFIGGSAFYKINIKAKHVEFTTETRGYVFAIGRLGVTSRGYLDVKIDDLVFGSTPASGTGRTFMYYSGFSNTDVNIDVDNAYVVGSFNTGIIFYNADSASDQDSKVRIRFGNGYFSTRDNSGTDEGLLNFLRTGAYNSDSTYINFICENCELNNMQLLRINQWSGSTNAVLNISGNYRLFGNNVAMTGIAGPTVIVNANITHNAAQNIFTGTGTFVLSGRLKTAGASVVNITGSTVALQNAVLLNTGANAAVSASSALNIACMGVYSNSTTTDADVTELVESIVKNTNVK